MIEIRTIRKLVYVPTTQVGDDELFQVSVPMDFDFHRLADVAIRIINMPRYAMKKYITYLPIRSTMLLLVQPEQRGCELLLNLGDELKGRP